MRALPRARALIIGINDYFYVPRLRSAVHDARQVAQVLEELHGYETQLFLDNKVTLALLRETLDSQREQTDEDTRLVVYFAGHGIAEESQGDDGPQGYLLPQDARPGEPSSFLPMAELYQRLTLLPCRHLLIVLDCCFAGAFRWVGTRSLVKRRLLYRERYDRYLQQPAWQVLTSSAHDERALDGPLRTGDASAGEAGLSPFAAAFIEGLRGQADLNGDGVVLASELHLFIEDQLATLEHRTQRPAQRSCFFNLRRRDKGEYLFLHPVRPVSLPSVLGLNSKNNPYRGLLPYEEEHQGLFFGRESVVPVLSAALGSTSLTALVGPSGSGKSSVMRAGLLPGLRKDERFTIVGPLRPGDAPLRALSAALQGAGWVLDTGEGSEDTLLRALRALAEQGGRPVLLIVDQLEESVTLCTAEMSARWHTLLAMLLEDPQQRVRLLLTLRSDFEPHFQRGPLSRWWATGRQILPALTQRELRMIIEEPAEARLLSFEPPGLVDRLINEVTQMPGALSLLSFALRELYENRLKRAGEDRALTEEDYQLIGGVVGALRQRVEEIHARLDHQSQATLRRLTLRMVSLEGGEVARRRVMRSELVTHNAVESSRITEVISALSEARLLVEGEEAGEPYVEPAHDALIRSWERLWRWIQEEEQVAGGLRQWRRLTQAARDWERKQGSLWDEDPRLKAALSRLAQEPAFFSPAETVFLRASAARYDERQRREFGGKSQPVTAVAPQSQGKIKVGESRWIDFSPDGTRLANASGLKVWVRRLDGTGEVVVLKGHDEDVELVQFSPDGTRLLSASRDKTAIIWQADGSGEPVTIPARDSCVRTAEFSPDSARIVLLYEDGDIAVWPADGRGRPITLLLQEARRACFSADGKHMHVESLAEGVITTRTWSFEEETLRQVSESTSQDHLRGELPRWAKQSRHGARQIAIVSNSELRIERKDGSGPSIPLSHPIKDHLGSIHKRVSWAEFSRDGTRLLTIYDDAVRVWQTDKESEPICFWPDATLARFSPDGSLIAAVTRSGVLFWQADGSDQPIIASAVGIRSFRFSPDGTRIVCVGGKIRNSVSIYNSDGTGKPTVLRGHDEPASDAFFTPDGAHIVVLAERPYVWKADGSGKPVVLDHNMKRTLAHLDKLHWSQDGRLLVISQQETYHGALRDSWTHRVFTLTAQSGEPTLTIRDSEEWILFGPGGASLIESPLASSYQDEQLDTYYEACKQGERNLGRLGVGVRRWSLDGSPPTRIPSSQRVVSTGAMASTDGSLIKLEYEVWGKDRKDFVRGTGLWRVPLDGEAELLVGEDGNPRDYPENASFSGDGTRLIGWDRYPYRVLLWRTDALKCEPTTLLAPSQITTASVSPNNAYAVALLEPTKESQVLRGNVAIWSLDSPNQPPRVVSVSHDINEVHFSPNGWGVLVRNAGHASLVPLTETGVPTVLVNDYSPLLTTCFSPDGAWLLTTQRDAPPQLHSVDGSRPPITIRGDSAQFTPDSTRILSRDYNVLLIWLLQAPEAVLLTSRLPPDQADAEEPTAPPTSRHPSRAAAISQSNLEQGMSLPEVLRASLSAARVLQGKVENPASWNLAAQLLGSLRSSFGDAEAAVTNVKILGRILASYQDVLRRATQSIRGTAAQVVAAFLQDLDRISSQAAAQDSTTPIVASFVRELDALLSVMTAPAALPPPAHLAIPPAALAPVQAEPAESLSQSSAASPAALPSVALPTVGPESTSSDATTMPHYTGPSSSGQDLAPRTALAKRCAELLLGTPELGAQYYILWGPRQSGKTWLLRAASERLGTRVEGRFQIVMLSMRDLLLHEDDPDDVFFRGLPPLLQSAAGRKVAAPQDWGECRALFLRASTPFSQPLILLLDDLDFLPGHVMSRILTLFESLAADRRTSIVHGLVLAGTGALVMAASARGTSRYPLVRIPSLAKEDVLQIIQQHEETRRLAVDQLVIQRVYELTAGQPGLVTWLLDLLTATGSQRILPQHMTEALLATWSGWNAHLQDLVRRGRAIERRQLIELFSGIPVLFSLDEPWCRAAYLDGIIEPRATSDKLGSTRPVCGFSSPLLQIRLFNMLAAELRITEEPASHEVDDSLKGVLAKEGFDCSKLVRRYQSHLAKHKLVIPSACSYPLSEGLLRLFIWLEEELAGLARVSPFVFSGETTIDLLIRLPDRQGVVSVTRYVNPAQLALTQSRAAYIAHCLGLSATTLAAFVRAGDVEDLEKLSGTLVCDGVEVTTVVVAC